MQVDSLFSFSQPLGSAYTGSWTGRAELVITIGVPKPSIFNPKPKTQSLNPTP